MAVQNQLFTITRGVAGDLSASQFLGVIPSAGGNCAVAGAGAKILGVLQNKPSAAGQAAAIMVHGITKGVSGAAVTEGAQLEMDAAGKFITLSAGVSVGFALTAAGGADELMTIALK